MTGYNPIYRKVDPEKLYSELGLCYECGLSDCACKDVSERDRLTAEVKMCIEMTELYPDNQYWQDRLAAALIAEHEYIQSTPNVYEVLADVLLEPDTVGEAVQVAYGEAVQPTWESPWTMDDCRDEIMNRYPD